MLAIARILRTGARFLMLDEPTEGLAPVIIRQIGQTIAELKREGFTILLVEQNFRFAATVSDRYYVMEHGRIDRRLRQCRPRRTWTSCMSTGVETACMSAPAVGGPCAQRARARPAPAAEAADAVRRHDSSATPSPPSSSSGNC